MTLALPGDMEFAEDLVKDIGVAAVPGSSFYRESADGNQQVRFCFCKRDETLAEAGRRLDKLKTLSWSARAAIH